LKYNRIFDLNLLKFQLAPVKQDGIIEPGCRVLVSSIKIENVGKMPIPTTRSVLAYIKPNDCGPAMLNCPSWVVSEGYDRFVQLPPGLEPNATVVVQCATFNPKPDGRIAPDITARLVPELLILSYLPEFLSSHNDIIIYHKLTSLHILTSSHKDIIIICLFSVIFKILVNIFFFFESLD
jgi:hypothetical protein